MTTPEGQPVESGGGGGGSKQDTGDSVRQSLSKKPFRDFPWTSARSGRLPRLCQSLLTVKFNDPRVLIGNAKRNAGSVDAVLARSSGQPGTRLDGGSRATTACLSRPGDHGRLIAEPSRVPGHLGSFNPARQVAEDGADETPSGNPQPQKGSPLTCSHLRTHGAGRLLAEIWDEVAVRGSEVPRARPCVGLAGDGDNSRVEGGDRGSAG